MLSSADLSELLALSGVKPGDRVVEFASFGQYFTTLLSPIVGEKGSLFGKQSDTRVWLTDDERRIPVQIRIRFVFGTITMRLKEMHLPPLPATKAPSPT